MAPLGLDFLQFCGHKFPSNTAADIWIKKRPLSLIWGPFSSALFFVDSAERFVYIHINNTALLLFVTGVGGLTDLSDLIDINQQQQHGGHFEAHLERGTAPQWRVQPGNEINFSNSTGARLECVASGNPPPSVEWFQEDELISQNLHGIRMVMPNGSLVFPPFK